MKKLQYFEKYLKTQEESQELCENTSTFWEKNRIEFQKNDDIELISCDMLKKLFLFFVSSLSSLSLIVMQQILRMNNNLLCLI